MFESRQFKEITSLVFKNTRGVTLVEIMFGVVISGIAVAGALEALRYIEKQSAEQVSDATDIKSFGSEFYSAYESVASENRPVSENQVTRPFLDLGWGVGSSANRNRVRAYCGLTLNSYYQDPGSGRWRFFFQAGDSASASSSAYGCPTTSQWNTYGTTLSTNPNTSSSTVPVLNFTVRGIGKLCTAHRVLPTPAPSGTWELADNSCILDKDDTVSLSTSSRVAFPLLTAIKFANANTGKDYSNVGSIFHSISRTEERLSTFCSVKRALRDPDFTLNVGNNPINATVTMGTGFRPMEDILVLGSGVSEYSAGFPSASITAEGLDACNGPGTRYGIATNIAGDEVHKYCNIDVVSGTGTTSSVDARFNTSTGFMLLRVTGGASPTQWTRIFDDVAYLNRFDLDDDEDTLASTVDRELSFSLGSLPLRRVNGVNHYYEFVPCASFVTTDGENQHCIGWQQAYDAVQTRTHLGQLNGYLTTITSEAENQFVANRSRVAIGSSETFAAGWLGGRDRIQEQSSLCATEITQPAACTNTTSHNQHYPWRLAANNPNTGDTATAWPGLGVDRTCWRNNDFWYWVGGPEACQMFWFGRQDWGQPIHPDGTITNDEQNTAAVNYIDPSSPYYQDPRAITDWNCDGSTVLEGIPDIDDDPTFGIGHDYFVGKFLRETVWGNGADPSVCNGQRDPTDDQCQGDAFRGTTETRFAAWSSGSTGTCTSTLATNVGEPNGDGNGNSSSGHFLQMTGLPSGRGVWNDLAKPPQAPQNRSWYNIKGYFVEYDDSTAPDNFVPSRTEVVNIARVIALCDDGPSGLAFEYDWID